MFEVFVIPVSQLFLIKLFFFLNRDAEEEEEGPGYISGLCAWRGEPGRVEAQRRQPDLGAPVGAGEDGAAAGGGGDLDFPDFFLLHSPPL